MNTEQFIRESAARGLSRRATRLALGIGPWVFREMLTLMPEITWPARGCSADHQRANEQKRGRCRACASRHDDCSSLRNHAGAPPRPGADHE